MDMDEEPTFEVTEYWEVLQCLGCENVTIRVKTDNDWGYPSECRFYPERTSKHHKTKHYMKLPDNLRKLYTEVVNAFNTDSLFLCTSGIRALLEGLCEDNGITEGPNQRGQTSKTLEGKINGLATIVPAGIVKNLHGLRFLGNQALHKLEVPTKADLELAMTVLEDILNVVYDLNYKSEQMYQRATRSKTPDVHADDISF